MAWARDPTISIRKGRIEILGSQAGMCSVRCGCGSKEKDRCKIQERLLVHGSKYGMGLHASTAQFLRVLTNFAIYTLFLLCIVP